MNKNHSAVFFISALLLLAVACKPAQQQTAGGFVGGTQGLTMSFVTDAPPSQVFDGNKFPFHVNVQLQNVGEWDITNPNDVQVTISGIRPEDYQLAAADLVKPSPSQILATKKDASGTVINGGIVNVDFPGFNFKQTLAADIQQNVYAYACYKYGTKVLSDMCVKKDLSSTDNTVCTVNADRTVQNSGAPVQLTSIRESQAGTDSILLTLTIDHKGTGAVALKGSGCSTDISKKDKVTLTITGLNGLTCTGLESPTSPAADTVSGVVTLFSGTRQITCTQPTGGQGDFVKPISATLEYDYNQFITTPITVKHV